MDEKFCETDIYDLLYRLGVTANYTGFFHTAYAVSLCMRQPDRLLLVTKWLYPEVAKRHKTNWKAVERENRFLLEQLAGKPLAQRPCTSQLLAILSSAIPAAYGLDEAAALMGECTGTGNRN